jgi:hypothetical protein
VEWSECSHLPRPAETLAHAPVMDHKTPYGLRPSGLHRTRLGGGESIRYLADDDVPMATDGDGISIRSIKEMEKFESLRQREFGHTRVYDVNLFERVGMDKELPLILWTIGWGKLYGGDRMARAMDGWLCNCANRNASIRWLTDSPLQSLQDYPWCLNLAKI